MTGPRLVDGVVRRPLVDGEEVISTPDGRMAVILNATGAAVADLCDGSHSAGDIVAFLRQHLPGAADADVDVDRVLAELRAAGLIQ